MTATTTPADVTDTPSWTIRPEQPIDLDQIHELHREAFRRTEEADLVDAIRSGAGFIPELSLVAVAEDGSILGHILVSRVPFEADDADAGRTDALALAPLAVLPEHSENGIGTALVEEAMAIADTMPEPLTAVLGAPTYYSRFGFVPAADHGINGPYDEAGEAFQVRPRRDAEVRPGTVHYPPAFAGV